LRHRLNVQKQDRMEWIGIHIRQKTALAALL
jgi:hypothetical protein